MDTPTLRPVTVLLTGATGFVGRHTYPALRRAGHAVVCTSRDPERARRRFPDREFRRMDVEDGTSVEAAMRGCQAAVYLVHGMSAGRGYEEREGRAAGVFREAAERVGVRRIVYLGGPRPSGKVSRHLRSRLATGEALRGGSVSTIELQATMIIGPGSESWCIVRDLAARLPFMVLPRWLKSRSEPIAIDDVTFAIVHAITLPASGNHVYALPGPEPLSAKEILQRVARLLGSNPAMVSVPVITPRLSSYWIRLVTRANHALAEELVEGLRSDLIAPDEGYWKLLPDHRRIPFDEAARRALLAEERELPWKVRRVERIARSMAKTAR